MTKPNHKRTDAEIDEAIRQYEKATHLLARGLTEQALDLYLQLIDHAHWLIPAYTGAAAASLEHSQFQQALDLATEGLRVLKGCPPNADLEQELTRQQSILLTQKAGALSGLSQHRQAIELAKETYKLFPSAQTLIELGTTLALAGKLDEAEEHYGMGLLETESPSMAMIAYNNMAVLLEGQSDFDSALKYFRRACEINPDDSKALKELATALAERGRYDEAVEMLETISDSDPFYAAYCEDIIRGGQETIEMTQDLITGLQEELAITPTATTFLNLALCYLEARQSITAITLMQKGLALEPNNLALITTLTDTLLRKRLLQPAIPIVKDALITHRDNPQLTSLQTLILARTHEHSKALHFFTTSTKLLGDKQTTFGEEPWALSSPSNRLLPSALKSYEYLIAAACEMKDWPLAIESLFAGLDLHLHQTLPRSSKAEETRLAVQKSKPPVLEQANFLTAASLEEDSQTVASLALILYNLDLQFHYAPLGLTIETLMQLMPEAQDILDQMLQIQSAFTSEETDDGWT